MERLRRIAALLQRPLKDEQRLFYLASTLVWTLLLVTLVHVGLLDFLEHRVVRALEFRARDWLGRSPDLDPKLKAYALDDSTAAMIGGVRISTEDWISLYTTIAARKPRAILVDGMFSSRQDVRVEQEAQLKALAQLPSPIAVGALLAPVPIKYREALPAVRFHKAWASEETAAAPVKNYLGATAYGPHPLFLEAYRFVGHIVQTWPARFAPAIRIAPDTVVPHIALFAANERRLTRDGVEVDGHALPLDDDGLAAINFLHPVLAAKRVKTLRQVLEKARAGEPLTAVKEGDVVLIINNYSTGNTDILDSPFGPVPGGYIILSIINSVVSGQWLTKLVREEPMILAFATVGTLMGYFSTSYLFWGNVLLLGVLHLVLSLAAFIYGQYMVPWLFPLTAMFGSAATSYALQRYNETKRRLHLEMEVATASALQQNFFPRPTVEDPRYSLAAYYHPAEAVGGDWYSHTVHEDRWLHIHLGDVTGHGTSAALLASFAKGACDMIYEDFRKNGKGNVPLDELHRNLNAILGAGGGKMALMTMLSIAIDLETGETQCLNSGHRPAIVLSADGSTISVITRSASTILGYQGLPPDFQAKRYKFKGDELILVLSDGLLDVPTSLGVRTNDKHLKNIMRQHAALEPFEIRSRVLEQLGLVPVGRRPFMDDVTFIVVKLRCSELISQRKPAEPAA